MRMPGVEPGSQAWEACMMPLHYMRSGAASWCNIDIGCMCPGRVWPGVCPALAGSGWVWPGLVGFGLCYRFALCLSTMPLLSLCPFVCPRCLCYRVAVGLCIMPLLSPGCLCPRIAFAIALLPIPSASLCYRFATRPFSMPLLSRCCPSLQHASAIAVLPVRIH